MIICTRNRAESLRQTLKSFECLEVPVGFKVDLLVVDNCSDDHTKQVILESPLKHIPVRYQLEERKGASYARNRGLKETTGEIILFTDDDVRPLPNWIGGMCQPLIDGNSPIAIIFALVDTPLACSRLGKIKLRHSFLSQVPEPGLWVLGKSL